MGFQIDVQLKLENFNSNMVAGPVLFFSVYQEDTLWGNVSFLKQSYLVPIFKSKVVKIKYYQ